MDRSVMGDLSGVALAGSTVEEFHTVGSTVEEFHKLLTNMDILINLQGFLPKVEITVLTQWVSSCFGGQTNEDPKV